MDCKLGQWEKGPCTATCGNSAVRKVTRKVLQQALNGGKPCHGKTENTERCNILPCPGKNLINLIFTHNITDIIIKDNSISTFP